MTSSAPHEEGLRSLGQQIDDAAASSRAARRGSRRRGGSGGGPPSRRRRRLKRALLVIGVVIVLIVGAAAGYGFYLNHRVHRVAVKGLTQGPTTGADAGTENILLVGSTSRCALKVQNPAYGLCTKGVTGINSDVVMILHLNPAKKAVSILSIPRTTFVPNARTTGAFKIDAALYQGPSQLVAAIEEDFAIPIQHYVELNFDTFASVVTALGGITMYFPMPVFDAYSGLDVQTAGCHHLNGVRALQVVRARHLQYKGPGVTASNPRTWPQEALSDLARIRRDHEFLRVLASTVAERGLSNPATDLSLVNALAPQLTVDSGLSATHMVNLVLTYHSVTVNHAPQYTLPVLVGSFGTYLYKGNHEGDIVFPTEPADRSVVDQFLGVGPGTNTLTGKPLPAPSSVTVSVVDGTNTAARATSTAQSLSTLGFRVVGTGSTTPVGQEAETVVTYSQRSPADEAAAQLVAGSLSGSVILAYGPTADGAQVTVTTGTAFSVDATAPAPAAGAKASAGQSTTGSTATAGGAATGSATTTGTTGAAPASTVTTGATAQGLFAPPTPSVNPLKPWDPRACPAGATGG